MTAVRVFDPAMCCSTGVCGPAVDPQLARFAADLDETVHLRGLAAHTRRTVLEPWHADVPAPAAVPA